MHDGVARVAGSEKDAEFGVEPASFLGQLRAVDLRHDDVGEEQLDVRPLREDAQRLLRAAGVDRGVAELAQRIDREAADAVVVLHHQHDVARIAQRQFAGRRLLGDAALRRAGEAGQVELHRRPDAGLRVDLHVPARLLDEAEHHRKTEPRALAGRLGREERIEGLLHHLRRHAGAGVGHRDHHILPSRGVVLERIGVVEMGVHRLDRQLAAAGHRIARVDGEIDERLLQLAGIDIHLPQAAGQHGLQRNLLAQRPAQQFADAADQFVGADRFGRQRLAAGEGEQALRQRRGAGGAFHGAGEEFQDVGRHPVAARQTPLDEVQRADDDRQHVVEVVRDAAGKLPDRLHLLDLQHLGFAGFQRFGLQPFVGDVAGAGIEASAVDRRDARGPAIGTVLGAHAEHGGRGAHRARRPGGPFDLQRLYVIGMDQASERGQGLQLVLAPAGMGLPGRIGRKQPPVRIGDGEHVAAEVPEIIPLLGPLGQLACGRADAGQP